MANVLLDLIRQMALNSAANKVEQETGIGQKIMDAIIPPAAASDASAIPQLLPADTVLTPEQEQMVMNRIATQPPERPRQVGRTYLPDIVMQEPTQPAMVDLVEQQNRQRELDDLIAAESASTTQDFVRQFAPIADLPDEQELMKQLDPAKLEAKGITPQKAYELTQAAGVLNLVPEVDRIAKKTGDDSIFDGFTDKIKNVFGDEEKMLTLALAFNTLRYKPDASLAAVLGKRVESLSTQRDRQRAALATSGNQTLKMLDEYPSIKSAYLSGQMDLKDALSAIKDMRRLAIDEGEPAAFRALKMRAKAAGLKEGTPEYNQFMINGGQRKGMSIRVAPDGTVEMVEGGDLSSMTEAQTNALTFSQRMKASNLILDKVEQEGTSLYQHIVNKVPLISGYLTSDEYKSYDQAKRDFINATLRKESGAAIAQSEFDNAEKQYFPVAGDSQQVIAQKKANRLLAQQLIEAGIPDVNKRVANMNIRGGVETLEQQPEVQIEEPQITPQQAAEELRRRRGQ